MISLDRAHELLEEHLKSENLKKHCIATAAIMKKLAQRFGESEEDWEIIGLLHDLDFDNTRDNPEKHTLVTEEILKKEGFPEEYIKAIKAHNEMTGIKRETRLDFALAASETITGLIIATALIYPDKRISSVKVKSIKKRMKEKAFARNVNRETIRECEKIGVELTEFIELSLKAMAEIEDILL